MTLADRPNRLPWPPLIFVAAVLAAALLGWAAPLPGWLPQALRWPGWLLAGAGLALDLAAMRTMRRQHANILPHRAATALVTTGPFALTRNPIYVGNTLAVLGAAFALRNPWFLAAALAAGVAVQHLAILREEAHLAAKFGSVWSDYCARVPRWLLWRG